MSPVGLGLLLGTVNTFVIAVGLSAMEGDTEVAIIVMMVGVVPGTVLGGLLGLTAHLTKAWHIWGRRILLTVPALLLVVLLARVFAAHEFILVSCIPTVVAAFLLERNTRLITPPLVPPARTL